MGEPEDYSLFITLHNGLCGKTGKMLSFQLRGQYGAVTVCRLRAGHVLSLATGVRHLPKWGRGRRLIVKTVDCQESVISSFGSNQAASPVTCRRGAPAAGGNYH